MKNECKWRWTTKDEKENQKNACLICLEIKMSFLSRYFLDERLFFLIVKCHGQVPGRLSMAQCINSQYLFFFPFFIRYLTHLHFQYLLQYLLN